MKLLPVLLFSALLLSWSALVSGQAFRCSPKSTSTICDAGKPKPEKLKAVLGSKNDPIDSFPKGIPSDPISIEFRCSPLFRTLDGSCTTLTNPLFGAAGTAQFSYMEASKFSKPFSPKRPSARLVSNIVSAHPKGDIPNERGINLLFVFFGQFLDHDLVLTPANENKRFDIPLPKGDPLFSEIGIVSVPERGRGGGRGPGISGASAYGGGTLSGVTPLGEMPFFRSLTGNNPWGSSGQQHPANAVSSAIDLSMVYGSDQQRFDLLHVSGSCKMETSNGNFLPLNEDEMDNAPSLSDQFFAAGDVRANENPALTSLHTVFLREHNKLCDELAQDFPTVLPKTLFELARKVNIFQMQKIVYEEFIPAIMGSQINVGPFDPTANPSVSNIFSTAAFRLGHTMVGNTLPTGQDNNPHLTAADMFFRNADFYMSVSTPGRYLLGAATTIAQEVDVKVVDTLRTFLFKNVPQLPGIDLVALNLQRGRDHALPSYNTVRLRFHLQAVSDFSDITSNVALQGLLSQVYTSVDNMDLWIALLAEDHISGASMGETMFRIWTAEFKRLAEGDRFFYTKPDLFNTNFMQTFTRFGDITSSTTLLRDILLRNTDSSLGYPMSIFFA